MVQSLLFSLLFCVILGVFGGPFISTSQFSALFDFYEELDGANWTWLTPYNVTGVPWNFSSPVNNPCQQNWQGMILVKGSCLLLQVLDATAALPFVTSLPLI